MSCSLDPFRFLVTCLAGWMNQEHQKIIDYLTEENRVLKQQLGGRRLRLRDESAPSFGFQGQATRPENAPGCRHDRDPIDLIAVASEVDRQ
jgi:hypothetical protein